MKNYLMFYVVAICFFLIACEAKKESEAVFDKHFTQLFSPNSNGVTGADGGISIALPDGRSVFLMGDSFLGEITDEQRDTSTVMINNTFIVVSEDTKFVTPLYQGTYDEPETFVKTEDEEETGSWYWPGHGFVKNNILHLFMSKFHWPNKEDEQWGFKFIGTDYLRFKLPNFEIISQEKFPYTDENNVHNGHAVLEDGTYVYIYGTRVDEGTHTGGVAKAHVIRAKVDDKKNYLTDFEFYTGDGWSENAADTKPMKGLDVSVSEQFTVFEHKGKYVLLTQKRGIGEPEIYTFTSDTPYGKWENKQLVYRTVEQDNSNTVFTYNTMAHPQYIDNGQLLICYNVNSLRVPEVFEDATIYRPRFFRVPMDKILK